MNSQTLWDMGHPDMPLARRDGPQTSREAAKAIVGKLPDRQAAMLDLLRTMNGATQAEIDEATNGRSLSKRLPELEARGLVRRGGRRENSSGLMAETWWVV